MVRGCLHLGMGPGSPDNFWEQICANSKFCNADVFDTYTLL